MSSEIKTLGIFGAGNLANAVLPLIRKKYPDLKMFLYTPTQSRAFALAAYLNNCVVVEQLGDFPLNLDAYFLLFKPQTFKDFNLNIHQSAVVVSFLAAINISAIQEKWPANEIHRFMPNTPSKVGQGTNLLYSTASNPYINELLGPSGQIFYMKSEAELDLLTPFTGSGPGLLFYFAQLLEAELNRTLGVGEGGLEVSKKMISQLFLGSSILMQSEKKFMDLKAEVTSKKGVTEALLDSLSLDDLEKILHNAFKKSLERLAELKK